MKQWDEFLAVCLAGDGGLVVVPTKRSMKSLQGRKFQKIILGRRAHGAGPNTYQIVNAALERGGRIESWARGTIVDMLAGHRKG